MPMASYDNGSSYTILGHLSEGPFHGWGATPGHGYAAAGGIFYTWSTYDNASVRSNWLGHTGTVRFYFEGKAGLQTQQYIILIMMVVIQKRGQYKSLR